VLEKVLFQFKKTWLLIAFLVTVFLGWQATHLQVDASFAKLLPQNHPFMSTFIKHQQFGGANKVIVALSSESGDIFNPQFMEALKSATDEVFFIPGVIRGQVQSLFTPNVRYIKVVKDGFDGGNVIPANFTATPEGLAKVRENILNAGILGRLVANDFSAALISANLQEVDPTTGEKLDYASVATALEAIRTRYENEDIKLHIVGFAKAIGDIKSGAQQVVLFFAIAFVLISLLLRAYTNSWLLTLIPLFCSVVAVGWQLGLLSLFGFGIDPMSVLIPFLIFAIGVSHSVQIISGFKQSLSETHHCDAAALAVLKRLLKPGCFALLSDTVGFLTIYFIKIPIIQEIAFTASIGVATLILTNLFLLPLLLSLIGNQEVKEQKEDPRLNLLWHKLSLCVNHRPALVILTISLGLLGVGLWQGQQLQIGDLHEGVPELWPQSRYNRDTALITERFNIGVDVFTVIANTVKDGCVHPGVMRQIDEFAWQVQQTPGVQTSLSLPTVVKKIYMGYNEGNPKWYVLPEHSASYAQSLTFIDTSSGLLNRDCDTMPIYIFTTDHKAQTIEKVVDHSQLLVETLSIPESECFDQKPCGEQTDIANIKQPKITFALAAGNVGVMAATNETVSEAQVPILLYVYLAVLVLCWLSFRTVKGVLCVMLPLALVSVLANALMAMIPIGLKVSTLPVVALGVGIGVDYGIYIFSSLNRHLSEGHPLQVAYFKTLEHTGKAVLFTGLTLTIAVCSWRFSALKFQADMGTLLAFMFFVNMLGALILLPALVSLIYKRSS